MTRRTLRNFHVPLPPETYEALRSASEDSGVPATSIVREAVEGWLDDRSKRQLAREISDYARAVAGTASDLDPDLEAAAVELLEAEES